MSENIFKEIYAKVLSLFKQTEHEDNAKDIAKNRLRVVLMQDRTNLTPELLERMRKELVELLSKYVEMDKEALELNFDQEGDQMALMLSIPVIRAKDEAEIEKALEEAKKDEDSSQEEEETEEQEDKETEETSSGEKDEETPENEIISEENDTEESQEEEEEEEEENSSADDSKIENEPEEVEKEKEESENKKEKKK